MTDSTTALAPTPKRSSRRRQTPPQPPAAVEAQEPPASVRHATPDAGATPIALPAAAQAPQAQPNTLPETELAPVAAAFLAAGLPATPPVVVQERPMVVPVLGPPMPLPEHAQPGAALGPLPPPEPQIPGSPFRRHDIVQILDPESRHFGGVLIVGDVLRDKVHGYFFTEGRHREYTTVRIQFCWYLGTSRVRAINACSPKWRSDVGGQQ